MKKKKKKVQEKGDAREKVKPIQKKRGKNKTYKMKKTNKTTIIKRRREKKNVLEKEKSQRIKIKINIEAEHTKKLTTFYSY